MEKLDNLRIIFDNHPKDFIFFGGRLHLHRILGIHLHNWILQLRLFVVLYLNLIHCIILLAHNKYKVAIARDLRIVHWLWLLGSDFLIIHRDIRENTHVLNVLHPLQKACSAVHYLDGNVDLRPRKEAFMVSETVLLLLVALQDI